MCNYIYVKQWDVNSHPRPNFNCSSVNSLAPGRPGCHFKTAIFSLVLLIGIFTSCNDYPLRWMSWNLTDDKSTLVQVMAWCRQATSHYLSQCWPSSVSPYGVTSPQCVKLRLTLGYGYKDLSIHYSQYQGCWWLRVARSRGISSHCIDFISIRIFQPRPLKG